eukprot:s7_g90.t1
MEAKQLAETAVHDYASFVAAVGEFPRAEDKPREMGEYATDSFGPELEAKLKETHEKAKVKWDKASLEENWDAVLTDMSAYRFSGEQLSEDPRRTADYRERVEPDPESKDSKPKAAAFWVPGTPRTTIRHVQHDTIPTGPPVKTPRHMLSPEAAEWIDQKIEEEVARGQLMRGNSPWGSPPFPTREAAAHQRARKRRIVVDYRRVNARVLRNSYYSRKGSEVIAEAAGSAYLTLLDAVTGFNQVENTDRAKRVLALLSRSGQFLPICLTFGPQNGPEDFAYVVDRLYAPGKNRKLRLMKQWLPYVDNLTIRTGRVLDEVVYRDEEMTARVRAAVELSNVQDQQIGEALETGRTPAVGSNRHGRGVVDEELKKYVGWVQIEPVKEWLGLEPSGVDLLRILEAACEHPDSKRRIEMGEAQSDAETKYIWARHSWSIPWITEGLEEADVFQEPAELFHGTLRKIWESIKRCGLVSEKELLGRKGRLHVHFCRARVREARE